MRRTTLAAVAVLPLLAAGCSTVSTDPAPPSTGADRSTTSPTVPTTTEQAQEAEVDPDTPLSWGPTAGELADAEALVAGWGSEQLAGQVLVGRYAGTDPDVPAALVRDLHLAGVCVTADNVVDEAQVLARTGAISRRSSVSTRRAGRSRTCGGWPPTSRPSPPPARRSPTPGAEAGSR